VILHLSIDHHSFEHFLQWTTSNDIAGKLDSTIPERRAGIDEYVEALLFDVSTYRDDARNRSSRLARKKARRINSIEHPKYAAFCERISLLHPSACIVGLRHDELCLTREVGISHRKATIAKDIVRVTGKAVSEPEELLEPVGRARGHCTKVGVHVFDAARLQFRGEPHRLKHSLRIFFPSMTRDRLARAPSQLVLRPARIDFLSQRFLLWQIENVTIHLGRERSGIVRPAYADQPRIQPLVNHFFRFTINKRLHEAWKSFEQIGKAVACPGRVGVGFRHGQLRCG
jgi:hypothetical protein